MKKNRNSFGSRFFRIFSAVGYIAVLVTVIISLANAIRQRGISWGREITVIRSYDEIKNWDSPAKKFLADRQDKDFSLEESLPIAEQNFLFLTGKKIPSGFRLKVGTPITKDAVGEYYLGELILLDKTLPAPEGFSILGHELGHLVSGNVTDPILGEAAARSFQYIWMLSYEDEKSVRHDQEGYRSKFVIEGKIQVTMATALVYRLWAPGTSLVTIFQALEKDDWSKLDDIN